ncbi:MAG: hypothetical protein ABI925_03815 [Verrucomicrobiota bacterium]
MRTALTGGFCTKAHVSPAEDEKSAWADLTPSDLLHPPVKQDDVKFLSSAGIM